MLAVLIAALILIVLAMKPCREHYRDPIFLNRQKYLCDIYPRANGTIYTNNSNVLTGFPFYDRAY